MRLDNKFFCTAGIVTALFGGQATCRIFVELKDMGGSPELLYLVLWAQFFALAVCGLKLKEYGSRRLKILSVIMLAASCLLLLLAMPATNLVMQAVVAMALCIIATAKLHYEAVVKSRVAATPPAKDARVRKLLEQHDRMDGKK